MEPQPLFWGEGCSTIIPGRVKADQPGAEGGITHLLSHSYQYLWGDDYQVAKSGSGPYPYSPSPMEPMAFFIRYRGTTPFLPAILHLR
jgi:hypothetical protein